MHAHVRPLSSTRTGRRPCSSASMSLGLHWWNAPLQINRMWSVLTLPYFVLTCTQVDNTPSLHAAPHHHQQGRHAAMQVAVAHIRL